METDDLMDHVGSFLWGWNVLFLKYDSLDCRHMCALTQNKTHAIPYISIHLSTSFCVCVACACVHAAGQHWLSTSLACHLSF